MKIALLGATGFVDSALATEAAARGHDVTGLVRNPPRSSPVLRVSFRAVDLNDATAFVSALAGHDVLVHAVKFVGSDPAKIIAAVKQARVPRLLVVGGAGSLEIAPGKALVDQPAFPAEYKAEALAGRAFLEALRRETDLDWTYLSPSADFTDGSRTGKFRLGKDQLLVGADGESRISAADYAIAMLNEIERPQHSRQRFTVGY